MTLKIHLGAGRNVLPGWQNHDTDVDLRKPLPWADGVVGYVFAEHVIEHLPMASVIHLLLESHRVLRPGGVLRLAFPDVMRLALLHGRQLEEYFDMLMRIGAVPRVPLPKDARALVVLSTFLEHGHVSYWTRSSVMVAMRAVGFVRQTEHRWGESECGELRNLEQHDLAPGVGACARYETTIVEGSKLW